MTKVIMNGCNGKMGQCITGICKDDPEIQIVAENILKTKKKLNQILAENTGKPIETIEIDTERDHYMSAEEALQYGIIDTIVTKR